MWYHDIYLFNSSNPIANRASIRRIDRVVVKIKKNELVKDVLIPVSISDSFFRMDLKSWGGFDML